MNRRMKIMGATGVVAIIASVLGTYFGSESTFTQGTVEVKDSIIKSKTTSVGLDNNGHSHLQDAKSGLDISTRGFGDTFHTEAKVDPSSRRKLICMTIEEIADLFQDTMSRTEASVVIVGEDGYEKQVVPIDGQFVDNGRTLHFGRGEDSVTMIMDSDVCNTAIPPADLDDIQVTFEEEEEVPYQLDTDVTVQDALSEAVEVEEAVPADDGIFNRARNLISRFVGVPSQVVDDPKANPDARVKVVDMSTSHGSTDKDPSRHLFSSSSSEVLARHRAEFEIAKRSPRGERKMQESSSVEICSGDGCESTSCTISGVDSDGSAGNLILDENGNLSLNGNTNDSRFFDSTTLGTAPDAITTFEDINNFIIAPGQTVDVLGTIEIKAVGVDIQEGAILNGNGGGYAGGARRTSLTESKRKNGSSPTNTNGSGQGGWEYTGGAGAGHGGNGGEGGWQNGYSGRAYGGSSYDTTLPSVDLQPGSGGGGGSGSGSKSGGRGGNGGAAIRLFAVDTIKIDGSILSNGETGEGCTDDDSTCGYSGGGGGSGGSISLSACTIDAGSSSLVQANGGAGGRSRYSSTSGLNCGGGGGGGGIIKTESTNTIGTLVLQVDGGAPPSGGRQPGEAGSVGKVFLTDNLEVEDSCDLPSYLDPSTPLDKNSRCASGFCRASDNLCGCDDTDDCLSSSEVCHTGDNKCYSSELTYEDDCSADNGSAVDARCLSNKCRTSDNVCGCDDADHCLSSSEVCHTDNKCYSSELTYEQDCSVDDGTALDARCLSNKCRSSDNVCGCTMNDDCLSSSELCHSDNKCYSSDLSNGESCLADDGTALNERCASGFCGSTDNKCGCTSNDHCPSGQACYSGENGDNKCYSLPSSVSSSTSCNAISGVESDGSAGDLIVADNGNLILINSNGIITDVSAQFARDAITTLENINNFIIEAGQTVNVLGTLIVKSKRTQIDGELNGTGGGYVGAVPNSGTGRTGESPSDTNGGGTGGSGSGSKAGGGGGSHAGRGGNGGGDSTVSADGGIAGSKYDDALPLTLRPGSGGGGGAGAGASYEGGAGGAGGAAIIFYSEEIVLNGNIYANGSNGLRAVHTGSSSYGKSGGGAGSGGSISFSACTLTAGSSAKIEAKGGTGGEASGSGYGGGGGGGGAYKHEASTVNFDDSMTINVDGGARGGSIYDSRAGFAGSDGKVFLPTSSPSKAPSLNPTTGPTLSPSKVPTTSPSSNPTTSPSKAPSLNPTTSPTLSPSKVPTTSPTKLTCNSNSQCSSNEVCETSTGICQTKQYRLFANCDLGVTGEGTNSRVSLEVKREGVVVYNVNNMNKDDGCPNHSFFVAGGDLDEFKIEIHGVNALGVDYFTLEKYGSQIKKWGVEGGGGWCFSTNGRASCWSTVSGAKFPIRGVTLYEDETDSRIKFSGGSRCRGNQSCSSTRCVVGGGSCGILDGKCCAPQ